MKIGVFDSGKGGKTVLADITKILPDEEYYYIADAKNCPYGEKTDEELMKIVTENVEELKKWGAEIIVIACNTATTRCIEKIREQYPKLMFVGTEPAIKLAVETDSEKILVMATPGTIKSERVLKLIYENRKKGQKIKLLSCQGLADAIEEDKDIDKILEGVLKDVDDDFDSVVLGCTHYSLIKERIQKYFPGARLIDGNSGVAKRVSELIEKIRHN